MLIGLGAALLAALLFGVGAVVQAVAARRHGLISRLMGLVVLMYVVGWGLHLVAIAYLPLYVAQVGVALSLVVTALVASTVVGEPLTRVHWIAIGAMAVGLALLVIASGAVGHHDFDAVRTGVLYAALGVTLAAALFAARLPSARGGVLLAVLAGVAYAGSPVATRALVEPTWDLAVLLPALTIGFFGLLGFWLYSLAMARTSVTAATAPVVLLQTALPALFGVVAFGDLVRPGWWPVAVAGFVVSTAGALVLSTAHASLDHLDEQPMVGWSP
jgi:drug/metabolite transporter (DMT)-like permease